MPTRARYKNGRRTFTPRVSLPTCPRLSQFRRIRTWLSLRPKKPESKPVRNALIGAAAGAAVVPGAFIPLAGLFGPAVIGSKIGDSLDKRTALGGGLGLLGGAAATGASVYALSQVTGYGPSNYLPLIAVASTLGVAGAVLGDKVLTSMNTVPAHRDYGQQWWSRHSVKEQQA